MKRSRSFVSVLLTLMIAGTTMILPADGADAKPYVNGSGTKDDPYIVHEYDELHDLCGVKNIEDDMEIYIKLAADLRSEDSLDDNNIVIGTENYGKTFGVTLDLAGHKIVRGSDSSDKAIIELRRWSELTINDSVGGGSIIGYLEGSDDIALISGIGNTQLTINGGHYEWRGRKGAVLYNLYGDITINDGEFDSTASVINTRGGYIYINGGVFNETAHGSSSEYGLKMEKPKAAKIANCVFKGQTADTKLDLGYSDSDERKALFYQNTSIIADNKGINMSSLPKTISGREIKIKTPVVDEIYIEINEPRVGEIMDFSPRVLYKDFKLIPIYGSEGKNLDCIWFCGPDPMHEGYKFDAGERYDMNIEFEGINGYVITEATKVIANGKPCDSITRRTSGAFLYSFHFVLPGPTATPVVTSKPSPTKGVTSAPTSKPVASGKPTGKITVTPTSKPGATVTPQPTGNVRSEDPKVQILAFVERIYTYVLDREPEAEGAAFWSAELYAFRRTGAEVAQGFIFSPEFEARKTSDKEFVTILYKTFFGRDPEEEGMNFWLSQLSTGAMDRITVANGFIYSQEWADTCASYGIRSGGDLRPAGKIAPTELTYAFVERMYTTAMGRGYDEEGRQYWASELANFNITGEGCGAAFFLSAEMEGYGLSDKEFLGRAYATFMNREADSDGEAYWLGVMASGASRADVVYGFTRSPEFTEKCVEARILPY